MGEFNHQSVLLEEALDSLNIRPSGNYIDATFGRGGHSLAILQKLDEKGRLIAFDQDPEAVAFAKQQFADEPRLTIEHCNFNQVFNNNLFNLFTRHHAETQGIQITATGGDHQPASDTGLGAWLCCMYRH